MKKIDLYKKKGMIFLYDSKYNKYYLDYLKSRFSFLYIYNRFFRRTYFLNYKFFLKLNLFYLYNTNFALKPTFFNFLSFYSFVPFFFFEKQFLFKKIEFEEFNNQHNLFKLKSNCNNLKGLNFTVYDITNSFDFDSIKIDKDLFFFKKFNFISSVDTELNSLIFFCNFNIFMINLVEIYKVIIFLNFYKLN